jgi:transcriptional regulator with XRE-family HTH domain
MGNMIKLRIEQILQEKRITKSAFADMLGIKKQNVNTILETRNLDKIQEIADILGVDYLDLITDKEEEQKPNLNGYVEYKEQVYKVSSKEDLENLLKIIEE